MGRRGAAPSRRRRRGGRERIPGHRVSRSGRVGEDPLDPGGDGEEDRGGNSGAGPAAADLVCRGARRRLGRAGTGRGGRDREGFIDSRRGRKAMNKAPINVQDSFFYNLRKDNVVITVRLTSGEDRMGRLRRFDKFALVLEVDGREEMIYKHAIATIRSANLPPGV